MDSYVNIGIFLNVYYSNTELVSYHIRRFIARYWYVDSVHVHDLWIGVLQKYPDTFHWAIAMTTWWQKHTILLNDHGRFILLLNRTEPLNVAKLRWNLVQEWAPFSNSQCSLFYLWLHLRSTTRVCIVKSFVTEPINYIRMAFSIFNLHWSQGKSWWNTWIGPKFCIFGLIDSRPDRQRNVAKD